MVTAALLELSVLELSAEVALIDVGKTDPPHDAPRLHVVAVPVGFVDTVGPFCLLSKPGRSGGLAKAVCSTAMRAKRVLKAGDLEQNILKVVLRRKDID